MVLRIELQVVSPINSKAVKHLMEIEEPELHYYTTNFLETTIALREFFLSDKEIR